MTPPGRWRSVACAMKRCDDCRDRHCGCDHHFELEMEVGPPKDEQ